MTEPTAAAPIGVLLTNLGTPDAPTTPALRRYLAEFLWDRRVVDLPRPLWWLILHGIILRTRPARSARVYQSVWTEQGSPLLVTAQRQCELLQQSLDAGVPGGYKVVLGMRYGNPSIAAALDELRAAGAGELVVLPLYPQNSCSTTASTFDAVATAFTKTRYVPQLRFIADYHDHPAYIRALADSIRAQWAGREQGERLIFSFHGTPERFRAEGDPYYAQCQRTAGLVAVELGLSPGRWLVTFQSRFGREPWLQPYTDETLKALPGEGVRSVDILCPGFSADCLETLEEIGVENAEIFRHHGGENFAAIPCLNDSEGGMRVIEGLVRRELSGWIQADFG